VLVIDNFATGRRDNLTPHPNLELVEGTIADEALVAEAFRRFQPTHCVHAAASYKSPDNWAEDARTNVVGTAIVAAAALRHQVRRLIYFQTALCYGVLPLEQPISLEHPLRPYDSSYAISKTAGENYIAISGIEFISFRLANIYGPRNLSGPLPTFFHRLSQGKKCFVMDTRRDFVFVHDMLEVVLKALDGAGGKGYYHVASGRDYSIKELYDEAVRAMGLTQDEQVEVRPRGADDAYTILLDASKTNRDFQWQATTPLREGVAAAVAYYRQFGVAETFTHLRIGEK
jgi:UDP-glucose 4-epimerase